MDLEISTDQDSQSWFLQRGVGLDSDNAALLALGRRFGRISWQGTRPGMPNMENDGVNRVEVMDQPMRDGAGNAVLSTNADEFPLHTDDSYNEHPARWVLMHCWQPDESGGGESWLSPVDEIAKIAPQDLLERLLHTLYPTPFGSATVLRRDEQGLLKIRFNRRDMAGFAMRQGASLSPAMAQDLADFEALAMRVVNRVRMERGDCVVVDNHKVLHGRSAFNPSSGRLLKRLRIL